MRGARTLRAALTAAVLASGVAGAAPLDGWRRGVNLEGWLGATFAPLGAAQLGQLRAMRAAGFDFVRVPLDPALFIAAPPGAAEPQASLDRLLREARARGLGVVVTLAPSADLKRQVLLGGLARDTYLALLERLAQRVAAANLPRALIEPLDEPVDPTNAGCAPSAFNWSGALSAFVAAAHRGAPALPVLVSGLCYADATSLVDLRPLADRNVVYGFQYLDPLAFTQQGNPTDDSWKVLRNVHYAKADAQTMRRAFELVGGWARRYGAQVMLTSFTVHRSAPPADRLRWLQDARAQAERQKFAWAAWTWQSPYGFSLSDGRTLPADVRRALGL